MAKIYRRPRHLHPVAELNITNMVDLGFTLLVIFMIAMPMTQLEQTIPVNLPAESAKPQAPTPDLEFKSVTIDRAGRFYYDNTQVTFAELAGKLEEAAAKPKQPVIRIRADLALQWQQVVRVMDEIKKHNLTKISIDTESK